MRRRLALWLAMVVVMEMIFCACSGTIINTDPTIDTSFACAADIVYNDMQIKANIIKSGESIQMEIMAPDTVKGLKIEWDGTAMTQSFAGASFHLSDSDLPDTALMVGVVDVFRAISVPDNLTAAKNENGISFAGNSNTGQFTVELDKTTGVITVIDIPGIGARATITDYSKQA